MRIRALVFLAVTFVVVALVTRYAVGAAHDYRERHAAAPGVSTDAAPAAPLDDGPLIVFRHTGIDKEYGVVATLPLDDPGGARSFTGVVCDRIDATAETAACLRTERGVVPTHVLDELDADWQVTRSVPVPGIPSRTRLSEQGGLVSTTTFVSGHSYMQTGFSTATEIHDVAGESHGNLERWMLIVHGERVAPVDRNLWGVTFADERTFYATAATGGKTYLVRGDLDTRTLTSIADQVECPSLSPGGTRLAYKEARQRDGRTHWTPAVLDLATGERTVLEGESRHVDDQIEWLDDDTILYGLPRRTNPASPMSGRSTPTRPPHPTFSSSRPGRRRWSAERPHTVASTTPGSAGAGPLLRTNRRNSAAFSTST